jgi:hypothetical protein
MLGVSATPFAIEWGEGGQVVLGVNRAVGGSLERLSGTDLNVSGFAGGQALLGLAPAPTSSYVAVAVRRSAGVVDVGIAGSLEPGERLKLNRLLLRIRTAARTVSISWR